MRITFFAIILALTYSVAAFAAGAPPPPAPNEPNCQAIFNACTSGGYIYGDAGQGNGLYKDCIGPLLGGAAAPKSPPAGVTFPSGPQIAQQAATCHKNHPKWGMGKAGH